MVNINPNRESCMEYMKELIRKQLSKTEQGVKTGIGPTGNKSRGPQQGKEDRQGSPLG